MQTNPLVSVIVPVYKVEPYLRKCLDSILAQTYRDLEIILVDDGSPDGCPAICDEYAAKDGRIRVIHQKNSGVSAARNAGMDVAAGEYIGFVDSDDWIEPGMYERLVRNAQKYAADISVCSLFVTREQKPAVDPAERVERLSGRQAQALLLQAYPLLPALYNKVYRRELLPVLKNDVDVTFTEDMHANYRAFGASGTIVLDSVPEYHGVPRPGSAVYSAVNQGHLDAIAKAEEMLREVRGDRELERLWRHQCAVMRLTSMNRIIKARRMTEQFQPIRRALLRSKREIFSDRLYSRREKAQVMALWLCPGLYAWAVRKKDRRDRGI